MASIAIKNMSGDEVGSFDYDLDALSPEINKQLLHDVVVMYEANKRVGTVKTKGRGEVAGSTKKLFRQKGTGRARAGASRTPVRKGGGHTFAKTPKDWTYRLPKKAVRLATRMALRSKFEDNQVCLVDSLSVDGPKTKLIADTLKTLGLASKSVLMVIPEYNIDLWRSSRNIEQLQVSPTNFLNAYDLLHQHELIITKDALESLLNPAAVTA
ncbi:50S ribosomal protein L4 [Polystyrenella longa]|uniref:Large ribosomal subunit protein uL4 n=1 Tax=Polystyrenella longa TaxID=2528007 RepID=A0A518CRA9_9PLAN|nr:50S ribosomal protein L4 [Polystyrenella longa]QDU81748.1 50S ribosomal protein L4 [Polystyrenella longa]